MQDKQLYQQILGLAEPWFVEQVELDVARQRVDIRVNHRPDAKWSCPKCNEEAALYDHVEERTWRHLDTCQFQTVVHARIPRVNCGEHGVLRASVPWAEQRSRFTLLFEGWIIDVLQQCRTVTGACKLLGVSWDEAWGVMQRAVSRGQARKQPRAIAHVGVDEKAFRKGHSYMTVVCDLDQSTVEYVAEARTIESLSGYYQSLSPEHLNAIEAVAMDMWDPYVRATVDCVPLAASKIVHDRFHIMKHMNDAVNKVRLQEHKLLSSQGDDVLKGTKHWWLYTYDNVPDKYLRVFEAVRDQHLRTSRAWAIKEMLRDLWDYRSMTWARKFFKHWFGWARRSRLSPVRKVAAMLKHRLENILNYCHHPITNAVAERLNSKIMAIKRLAGGYRHKENFKTVIHLFCGGLDLYPR